MTQVSAVTAYPTQWKRPPLIESATWRIALWLGALLYLVLAIGSLEVDWARLAEGLERGGRFVAAFAQPDFTSRWSDILAGF
ncbi:MAG: phosphonate ABC transporter, permease protein PhnE, partial [Ferrovibrio sp.]